MKKGRPLSFVSVVVVSVLNICWKEATWLIRIFRV